MTEVPIKDILRNPTVINRKFRDSGYLQTSNSSTITSGSTFVFTLDERFIPYDDVLVVNLDVNNDCELTVNFSMKQPLPAGNKAIPTVQVRDIRVKNLGTTTISADQIYIYYRHTHAEGEKIISRGVQFGQIISGLSSLKNLI